MNRDEYEDACNKIFDGLDRYRPSKHPPISMTQLNKLARVSWHVMSWGAPIAGAGLGACIYGDTGGAVFLGVIGGVVSGALNLMVMGGEEIRVVLTIKALSLFNRGAALDKDQAGRVAELTNKYPRIKEAVINWVATSSAQTLTTHDMKVLNKASDRLAETEKQWEQSQAERQQYSDVALALNKYGMLDIVAAKVQATNLNKGTALAAAVTAPTRRF